MGETSATGVAFTRNPSTGDKALYGEFLVNAQGEDVVAGIRTPQDLTEAARACRRLRQAVARSGDAGGLRRVPRRSAGSLERHYRDMQDLEFTIERGKLWMLQTRVGQAHRQGGAEDRRRHGRRGADHARRGGGARRSGGARPAPPPDHRSGGRPRPDRDRPAGLAGRRVRRDRLHAGRGRSRSRRSGKKVILVRVETSPEDIHGMHAAEGILTTRGGMTSHAAVVARGMGKPCVSGAGCDPRRLPRRHPDRRRPHAPEGRHHHHRRLDRRGACRRDRRCASRSFPAISRA